MALPFLLFASSAFAAGKLMAGTGAAKWLLHFGHLMTFPAGTGLVALRCEAQEGQVSL
jgi:hypothetical protein